MKRDDLLVSSSDFGKFVFKLAKLVDQSPFNHLVRTFFESFVQNVLEKKYNKT